MQRIPARIADEGMVLAKAVTSSDGMVLAGKGFILTKAGLDRIRNAGIGSIFVKGRPFPNLPEDEQDLEKMKSRLDYLFRKYRQDPLMWTFKNMVEQYLAKRIALLEEAAGQPE